MIVLFHRKNPINIVITLELAYEWLLSVWVLMKNDVDFNSISFLFQFRSVPE